MCIVIDINTLPSVFKRDNADHLEFKPVLDWIFEGKGKVVYGGTKFKEELSGKFLVLFVQLKKAGKAIEVPANEVDAQEEFAKRTIEHPDFDDPHIVGLLRASGCKLICSLDARAYPYFRHTLFFSPADKKPKIYSRATNSDLLTDANIADICKPCVVTTNEQKKLMIAPEKTNKQKREKN